MDERVRLVAELYERAIFNGRRAVWPRRIGAGRGRADLVLARGKVLHGRSLRTGEDPANCSCSQPRRRALPVPADRRGQAEALSGSAASTRSSAATPTGGVSARLTASARQPKDWATSSPCPTRSATWASPPTARATSTRPGRFSRSRRHSAVPSASPRESPPTWSVSTTRRTVTTHALWPMRPRSLPPRSAPTPSARRWKSLLTALAATAERAAGAGLRCRATAARSGRRRPCRPGRAGCARRSCRRCSCRCCCTVCGGDHQPRRRSRSVE